MSFDPWQDDLCSRRAERAWRKNLRASRERRTRAVRVASAAMLALALAIVAWHASGCFARAVEKRHVVPLAHLAELQTDQGWQLEGTFTNAEQKPVAWVGCAVQYTDAEGNVVSLVMVDARNLQPGETRKVEAFLPNYSPGMIRSVLPAAYVGAQDASSS